MSDLKIKICGMTEPGNIGQISRLNPDYMGFIFYPQSSRYAGDLTAIDLVVMPDSIRKVGVFVDAPPEDALAACRQMGIRIVQLHGAESPEYCRFMKQRGLVVFKAIRMEADNDFSELPDYRDACDYFLLDTSGPGYGGTGIKFDWERLNDYKLGKPFFLSGGIGPGDASRILKIKHEQLYGVDLNSRFEIRPGIKKYDELEKFISAIRHGPRRLRSGS